MEPGRRHHAGTLETRVAALPFVPENPYQTLFYDALREHGVLLRRDVEVVLSATWLWRTRADVDVLHFHWPQCYYTRWTSSGPVRSLLSWVKLGAFASRLLAARALGYRLAWTIHEVLPFESTDRRLERVAAVVLANCCQVLLANDPGSIDRARAVIGRQADRIELVEHGSFAGFYPPGRSRETMRKELGLGEEETVFLSFGNVRGYKNLDVLLEAFRRSADLDASLVIAGLAMDDRSVQAVRAAAAADPRVKPLLQFVPVEEVAELFDMSDVGVLARGDGGTSSALVLALSLGKPVIAADVEDYRRVAGNGEAGWFFSPGDPESLAGALAAACAGPREAQAEAARRCGGRLSWAAVAERTANLLAGRPT